MPVTTIGCNHNKSKITDPSSSLNNYYYSQLLRVKECAKAVMLTSQANTLLVVAVLWVCCLHTACTIPIPSQASANSSTISTVVLQVVASLPTGPGRGTVNATTLSNMIVEGLTEGGLECNGCKKRGEQYFLEQFTQSTQLSGCLSLVKVPLPGNRTYPGSPPPYILTGSTNCLTPRLVNYDSQCFPRNAAPKCTWSQNVRDLGDSVFPRFVVSVNCSGCKHYDDTCLRNNNNCYTSELRILPVYILKRQDECDSSGNEVWRPIAEKVVVGCSCSRTN